MSLTIIIHNLRYYYTTYNFVHKLQVVLMIPTTSFASMDTFLARICFENYTNEQDQFGHPADSNVAGDRPCVVIRFRRLTDFYARRSPFLSSLPQVPTL